MTNGRVSVWLEANQYWFGPVGAAIGVVGIIFSIYFFVASKESGEVTLRFSTVRIVQAGVPSIKILDKNNNPITSNVYGCEITVWNTGSLTLGAQSDRAREPLTIAFTSNDLKIVDVVVQDTKNVSRDAIKLDRSESRISVIWSQFDPGDAIKIFVIYTSNAQSPIEYRGRFLRTRFKDLSGIDQEYPEHQGIMAVIKFDFDRKPYISGLLLLSLIVFPIMLILALIPAFRRQTWSPKVFFGCMTAALIANFLAVVLDWGSSATPFP